MELKWIYRRCFFYKFSLAIGEYPKGSFNHRLELPDLVWETLSVFEPQLPYVWFRTLRKFDKYHYGFSVWYKERNYRDKDFEKIFNNTFYSRISGVYYYLEKLTASDTLKKIVDSLSIRIFCLLFHFRFLYRLFEDKPPTDLR